MTSLLGNTDSGALQYRTPCGVSIGFGCHGDVLPKEGGEVTLVRAPDLGADLVEEQRGLRQQVLRTLHSARGHVLMRRLPGRLLERARKMGGARLRHSGELGQG